MCTIEIVKQLVKEISTLSISLSNAVLKRSKNDKIWFIMNSGKGDTPHENFNCHFNALFGKDCHDSHGCLHHVCQSKLGMGLMVSYLLKIDWTDFPLDLVELKLQCLVVKLQHLQCILKLIIYYPCWWFYRQVDICSTWALNLLAKLKGSANTKTPQLSFQCKAVQDFHSQNDDKNNPPLSPPSSMVGANINVPLASMIPTPQFICTVAHSDSDDESEIIG